MNEDFARELRMELGRYSLSPDDEQTAQFERFYELLMEWNEKMNLTAVTGQDDVIRRHFADSLAPMALVADLNVFGTGSHVIDVGTGAGFPGIPLKIMDPSMKLTLLDSLQKRTIFLEEAVKELSLADTEIIRARAEELGRDEAYREKYDLCVSRAVANLSTLSEYCLPFVRVGGVFIAYKSAGAEDELHEAESALRILGGEIKQIKDYKTPDGERALIVIEKKEKTPGKYPRRAGRPGKDPIREK